MILWILLAIMPMEQTRKAEPVANYRVEIMGTTETVMEGEGELKTEVHSDGRIVLKAMKGNSESKSFKVRIAGVPYPNLRYNSYIEFTAPRGFVTVRFQAE